VDSQVMRDILESVKDRDMERQIKILYRTNCSPWWSRLQPARR
jgi:hypothetical protein